MNVSDDTPDLSWVRLPDDPRQALDALFEVYCNGFASALATSSLNHAAAKGMAETPTLIRAIQTAAEHQILEHLMPDPAWRAMVETHLRQVLTGDHAADIQIMSAGPGHCGHRHADGGR